jgi:hypothetical protein
MPCSQRGSRLRRSNLWDAVVDQFVTVEGTEWTFAVIFASSAAGGW